MSPILGSVIALGLTAFLSIGPTACKPKAAGNSILTATVAGREIRAVIEDGGFIHPESDRATISFTGHKVTVEPVRVLRDGTELAKVPTTATKVEVTVSAGQLTVIADGVVVTARQLSQ